MKNRETVYRLVGLVDNIRVNLKRMVKTGQPLQDYINELNRMETLIEEIKSMIEMEPLSIN